MSELVSVVIPTYNAANYIVGAVQSALDQTYPDCEVIVVDDGSTDDTESALSSLQGRISYIRQANRGANAARNHGVSIARGEYIAFLDSDDSWYPDKIERQMQVLKESPDFEVVHCNSAVMDSDGNVVNPSANAAKQSRNGRVFEEFFQSTMSPVLTSSVLLRKNCFDTVGPLDETGDVVDDHDFFLRIAWHYPIFFIPEPLLKYRLVPRSLSRQGILERIQQHANGLQRCIDDHPDYFSTRSELVAKRWNDFNLEAAYKLYYGGCYALSHDYFKNAAPIGLKPRSLRLMTAIPAPVLKFLLRK